MDYGYLLVEGPHDLEWIAKLLRRSGLERIKDRTGVPDFFQRLIPRKYPHPRKRDDKETEELGAVPVPTFLKSEHLCVAIRSAGGIDNFAAALAEDQAMLAWSELKAIGLVVDADDRTVAEAFGKIRMLLPNPPAEAGAVTGAPRCGVYVLPDNLRSGRLENLLEESAATAFPELLAEARSYVHRVGPLAKGKDFQEFRKEQGLEGRGLGNKVVVAALATALKPGRAIHNSIQDNPWLGENLSPGTLALENFLKRLLFGNP